MEGIVQGFDAFLNLVIEGGIEVVKREDQVTLIIVLYLVLENWFSDVYSPFTQKERIEIGMVVIRGKSVESLVALEPLQ